MNLDMMLSYGVTLLGALLCLFSMVFIALGRKVVGEGGTQVIKVKDVEVRTNSVVMLIVVSVVVAVLPLILQHYRPVPSSCPPVAAAPAVEKRPLYITGYVHKPDGSPLEEAQIVLFKLAPDGSSQKVAEQTAESDGSFAMSQPLSEGDRLKISTTKRGYINQTIILGLDSLNYPAVLVEKR